MRKLFLALALFATASTASAQDWPKFLGPTGDSKSTQTNLLREWPAAGPEVVWTTDVGIGYGGPVVQNGKVYLLDRNHETEEEIMRSFDLKTGKELWSYKYSAPGKVQYPGSRSVPTVDGKYVYSVGHSGHFYCFEAETGKPVWNKNIWSEYGGTKLPVWAISQCPLIYGDLVIVSSLAPNAGLLAYNKVTGDLKWKTENLGPESYTSPTIVKVDGEDHLSIVISSTNTFMHREAPVVKGRVIGLNPNTGEVQEILIECTETRDQPKNKERALSRLRTFIYDKEHQKYIDDIAAKRKTMVSTGDRSAKIRTYNYPQGRITDHRINYTIYNLGAFMDGDIQDCIDHLIVAENAERLKESEL